MLLPLQVLLSPPIVVYSPRVLPVYVYDAHADCGKNVRFVEVFWTFLLGQSITQFSTNKVLKSLFISNLCINFWAVRHFLFFMGLHWQ